MEAAIALEKERKITRPVVDCDVARRIALENFPLAEIIEVKVLNSYDDANFLVTAKRDGSQADEKFVLKACFQAAI